MNRRFKLSALAVGLGAMVALPAFAGNPILSLANLSLAATLNFQGITRDFSNQGTTNRASLHGNALRNSNGNIGVNEAAGNRNLQGNHVTLATAAGSSTEPLAGVLNDQDINNSYLRYRNMTNSASVKGHVLQGSSGNIGVNVVAGAENIQANNLAIAKGNATPRSAALAAVFTFQNSNPGCHSGIKSRGTSNRSSLSGNALYYASGNIGVNVASGGQNMQANDTAISRSTGGSGSGALTLVSQQTMGNINAQPGPCPNRLGNTNVAMVSGNVLRGASGNIGMNVAAGYGNLQSNTLSMSTTTAVP